MDKLISVVVPGFNPNISYLKELFDSIEKMDNSFYELLFIDDGSEEKTSNMIKLECNERNFKYYKIVPNQGVSNARNFGIEKSNGQYILFLDADDLIDPTILNNFLKNNSLDADIYLLPSDNLINYKKQNFKNNFSLISENKTIFFLKPYFNKQYFSPRSACSKLFKKKLLINNEVIFNVNLKYSEDTLFNIMCFQKADKIGFISGNYFYYSRTNLKSVSRTYKKSYNESFNLYFVEAFNSAKNDDIKFFICKETLSIICKVRICMSFKCFKIHNGICFLKSNAVIFSSNIINKLCNDYRQINKETWKFASYINRKKFHTAYFYIVIKRFLFKLGIK